MNKRDETQFGGCHCGAIRYQLDGKPVYVSFCHCEDCRRSTGALAVVYAVYLPDQVQFIKGQRKSYQSSPGVIRTFCSGCGTSLSYEAEWQGQLVMGFFVASLDNPEAFPPERHVFDSERISWFNVTDELPHYDALPDNK
ncbi:GFA family protein [Marinomonas pollencensis]|uniref:CENP-V/GFA domain-containing protein n=1 Tax=Marinomonas pollencensis TaxID=491954 RepID=A0A3E0DVU8_9GAMM|nr:GFA family protein [Marinomonas pollencensis]REG86955.1 hypothetical protein DFP81_101525 [Marinomonas pollencensis]